jgi:serine/threonine protein kinase/WD40 repeat protein
VSGSANDSDGTFDEGPISQKVSFAGWKPGDIIDGRLQIMELIGKGGMGVVWRVHHREWNKELAVKMPLPALVGSPTARDRFLREAETWIDLGVHPHIVQCWFVMDISGLPSLFLDFLTGGSLKQWIDGGHIRPGQWQRILEIAIQVSEGMAYAHSRGVIHRDIKPANLLIRGDERVCVTDFGIVKTAGSVDEPSSSFNLADLPKNLSITGTGAFLGTPQYGAPEQWGSAEEVDAGADIYALGVTIYEMCCGRRPFDADAERLAPEVLIDRHLTAAAPDPRSFYPDVPADLAQLVLLCLEKDPKRRPQTMQRLQEALEGVYRRLVGRPYQGVGSVPSEQRPDTLNNRAVSLYSLAKRDEARDVWRRGLRIESGHPECLYNLTQIDKRAGRMDAEEALRRLRQARAGLPLALLCIEESLAQEAVDLLRAIKPNDGDGHNNGPTQRALGDALMYTQQYYAAEKAYRSALTSMPADTTSQERKRLANLGKRSLGGRFLFPSPASTFHIIVTEPHIKPLILSDSHGVVGITESTVTLWNIDEECVVTRSQRAPGSTAVRRAWSTDSLMLAEDQDSFELRRLPDLTLLGRKSGQIVALTRNLQRILVAERGGVFVFDVRQSTLSRLDFGPGITGEGRLLACFDQSGDQLCLLLPTGRIAQPDEDYKVVPENWPASVEDAGDATCLVLSHNGAVLYIGHASGRLQALNFVDQRVAFDLRLPFPIKKLELASHARNLVVTMEPGCVIVDRHGGILCQGDGPLDVDYQRNRCLVFHQGRLELFDLRPFRRLRTWSQVVNGPRCLALAEDGRRAVSLDASGRIDVWEVDEDSRVFERSFLLSPGRSYAEIVSASKRFRDSLGQAEEALSREQVPAAYRHLNRARSVEGYAQAPDALDLNWRLLSTLRRGKLEAVWERLNFDGDGERPGPIALSEDGHHLLVTFGPNVTLYVDTGTETKSLWSFQAQDDVVAVTLLKPEPNKEVALILDRQGEGGLYRLSDGSLVRKVAMGKGPLQHIAMRRNRAYYSRLDGSIGVYDTLHGEPQGEVPGLIPPMQRFFPYSADIVIVSGEEGFGTVTLGKGKAKIAPIRLKGVQCVSPLSYARYEKESSLLHLGFEDGSLIICDAGRSRPVFQLAQAASGAISGFELVPNLSVGIASTSKGQLLFFDLHTGVLLEEFSAHRGKIQQLCVSANGRYLATAARGGHVRLWETSWTACEDEREPPLEWLPAPTALTKISQFLGLGGKPK